MFHSERMNIFTLIILLALTYIGETSTGEESIPPSYHGIWDASQNACKSRYSDIRLIITDKFIEYWESQGKLLEIVDQADDSITVKLSMAGEGEHWTQTSTFKLSESKLVSVFEDGTTYARVKCANETSQEVVADLTVFGDKL